MISIIKTDLVEKKDGENLNTVEIRGLSTDTKPIDNIGNGSIFIEIDTGKIYFYDLDSETWKEV